MCQVHNELSKEDLELLRMLEVPVEGLHEDDGLDPEDFDEFDEFEDDDLIEEDF